MVVSASERIAHIKSIRSVFSLFLSIILLLSFSGISLAAPGFTYSVIKGEIIDMWMAPWGYCYFKIAITEETPQTSHDPSLVGEIIVVSIAFYNESSGEYVSDSGSEGWMVGDIVNGTLEHGFDEHDEWYSLSLPIRSETNYADTTTFLIRTSYFQSIEILFGIAIGIVGCTKLYLRKKKGERV